ncbi:MAG: sensor histidine kinase [Chloroflexi bacterium]|nr:MAG: sensor histidine kinase [Chloroflexota bacterium]
MLQAVTARVPWVSSRAARRRATPRPRDVISVSREVLRFVLGGLLAAVLIAGGSFWAVSSAATGDAINSAELVTQLDGHGIVEPSLSTALLSGDPDAVANLDRIVHERVLGDRVVRVKVWTGRGRVVYSDARQLIGRTYELGDDEEHALATGETDSELSDLTKPENRYEVAFGTLLEVYMPVHAADGRSLLFETYQRDAVIEADRARVWSGLFPALVAGIALLFVVEVPLSWRLARRLERSGRERAALLERAIDSSELERRRIAADLHDGPVQYLTALSLSLGVTAEALRDPSRAAPDSAALVASLDEAGDRSRTAIRELRSLILEVAPADLAHVGLAAAIDRLAATARDSGLMVRVHAGNVPSLSPDVNALIYRAAQEAIRNVIKHARASTLTINLVQHAGAVVLEVVDDGKGFDRDQLQRRRQQGHVGLSLLEDRVGRAGARLTIDSAGGRGTTVRLEVSAG